MRLSLVCLAVGALCGSLAGPFGSRAEQVERSRVIAWTHAARGRRLGEVWSRVTSGSNVANLRAA